MKILITGGTGFIGAAVLDKLDLNAEDVKILNLTRNSLIPNSKKVEHFKCDLSNLKTYEKKVENFEPEVVIHLAWEGIPNFSLEMCNKNMLISISFIDFITKLKSCKKFIITGSCFEYNNKIGRCNENDKVISKDYFTFAKKTVLSFLELECNKNNIVYCWARLFYVYGPKQRSESLIPTLIETLKSNKTPNLRTPKNANDFIHVQDVASGLNKMIFTNFESGIYNLGSGKSTPVIEVSKIVELELTSTDTNTQILLQKTIETEKTVDFFADIQKTREKLNWEPKISLNEGIKKLLN